MNNLKCICLCCSIAEYKAIQKYTNLSFDITEVSNSDNFAIFDIEHIQPEQLKTIEKVLTKLNDAMAIVCLIYSKSAQERIQHYVTTNNIHTDIESDDYIVVRNEYTDGLTIDNIRAMLYF